MSQESDIQNGCRAIFFPSFGFHTTLPVLAALQTLYLHMVRVSDMYASERDGKWEIYRISTEAVSRIPYFIMCFHAGSRRLATLSCSLKFLGKCRLDAYYTHPASVLQYEEDMRVSYLIHNLVF
jgi:hypothetical protein